MTATNEAWISDSLARLEQLESQREQLAASGRTDALAELDEEIKSLYEVLESAAEEEASAANNSPVPATSAASSVPHPAFGPTPTALASHAPAAVAPAAAFTPVASPVTQSPFDGAAASAPSRMSAPPSMMSAPSIDSGDDDVSGGGKGGLIAGLVVVLLAAGGGGWWYMNRAQSVPTTTEAPAGPAKVIQAGAIPEDTQEPDVAKGGEATRTPGITIKEPPPQDDRRPSGPRPSGNTAPRPASKPEKDGRPSINVDASNDPLAGVK
jgi:hypothetical protein